MTYCIATLAVENFGRFTHPDTLVEKTLADGDNKSLLLVRTELVVMWLHGDDVYSGVEKGVQKWGGGRILTI